MVNTEKFVILIVCLTFILSCSGEGERSAVSSDGVTIAYEVNGKGEPAIVFVHGWTNTREIWRDQISHFSKKYRTLAMDLPGTGKSGNNRLQWSIKRFGEDVAELVRNEKLEQVVLVGFSLGGPVVIEAANLLQEETIGVVLVNSLEDPDRTIPEAMLPVLDSMYMDLVTDLSNEKLLAMGFYKKNPEASFARLMEIYPDGISYNGWRESLAANFNWINRDCISSLKKLRVPLVSINSDQLPTNVEAFKQYLDSYEAKIMTGMGHLVFWDDPEGFNRHLESSILYFVEQQP